MDQITSALERMLEQKSKRGRDNLLRALEVYWLHIERLVTRGDSAAAIARCMVDAGFAASRTNLRDAIGEKFPTSKRSAPTRKNKRGRRPRVEIAKATNSEIHAPGTITAPLANTNAAAAAPAITRPGGFRSSSLTIRNDHDL